MTYQSSKMLKSALAKARGLGSAKKGLSHWKAQRISALALIPLGIWFIFFVAPLVFEPPQTLRYFLQEPCHSLGMILFILSSFYHGFLGVQTIIEDYIQCPFTKTALLIFCQGLAWILSVFGIFSVVTLSLQAA